MGHVESESSQEYVFEISTGTLFKRKIRNKIAPQLRMVIDIGEQDFLYDVPVYKTGEHYTWTPRSIGTMYTQDFGEYVGQLSLDQVMNGMSQGHAGVLDDIKDIAKKGSRTIVIKTRSQY